MNRIWQKQWDDPSEIRQQRACGCLLEHSPLLALALSLSRIPHSGGSQLPYCKSPWGGVHTRWPAAQSPWDLKLWQPREWSWEQILLPSPDPQVGCNFTRGIEPEAPSSAALLFPESQQLNDTVCLLFLLLCFVITCYTTVDNSYRRVKVEAETCNPIFITALFTVARTQKQTKCPMTDEWTKTCYIYTMEYYSVIKKNEMGSFVEMWMDLESVIRS